MDYPSSGQIINGTPPFIDIPMNIDKLEDYVNLILPLDIGIVKAKKEKQKWEYSTKTVVEIKKEAKKVLDAGISRMEGDLAEEIKRNQNRQSNAGFVINVLKEVVALKNLSKHFDEIKKTDLAGVTESLRIAKIIECNEKIQKLEKEKAKYFRYGETGAFIKEIQYVERWKVMAIHFGEEVDAGGRNILHNKRMLALFNKLELGKLPRPKLYRPIVIDNKEYDLHPGWHKQR